MREYKPHPHHETPIDPLRCKESVPSQWHFYQCQRKAQKDGWCKQHHPDTVAARRKKQDEEYEAKRAAAEARRYAPALDMQRRCAEVAREQMVAHEDDCEHDNWNRACRHIAKAIEELK